MSTVTCEEIAVGVKGRRILMTGYAAANPQRTYPSEETLDLDLAQAREAHRLLGAAIKLAEKSPDKSPGGNSAEIVSLEKSAR